MNLSGIFTLGYSLMRHTVSCLVFLLSETLTENRVCNLKKKSVKKIRHRLTKTMFWTYEDPVGSSRLQKSSISHSWLQLVTTWEVLLCTGVALLLQIATLLMFVLQFLLSRRSDDAESPKFTISFFNLFCFVSLGSQSELNCERNFFRENAHAIPLQKKIKTNVNCKVTIRWSDWIWNC